MKLTTTDLIVGLALSWLTGHLDIPWWQTRPHSFIEGRRKSTKKGQDVEFDAEWMLDSVAATFHRMVEERDRAAHADTACGGAGGLDASVGSFLTSGSMDPLL